MSQDEFGHRSDVFDDDIIVPPPRRVSSRRSSQTKIGALSGSMRLCQELCELVSCSVGPFQVRKFVSSSTNTVHDLIGGICACSNEGVWAIVERKAMIDNELPVLWVTTGNSHGAQTKAVEELGMDGVRPYGHCCYEG